MNQTIYMKFKNVVLVFIVSIVNTMSKILVIIHICAVVMSVLPSKQVFSAGQHFQLSYYWHHSIVIIPIAITITLQLTLCFTLLLIISITISASGREIT